jgi:hypothetical protein
MVLAALLGLAAVADLARCSIGITRVGGTSATVLLLVSGGVAAAGSVVIAGGAIRSRRWALWSAALIGIGSAPQAAMTGFRAPYTIPDVASAVLGLLVTITVLVGGQPDTVDPAPPDAPAWPVDLVASGRR